MWQYIYVHFLDKSVSKLSLEHFKYQYRIYVLKLIRKKIVLTHFIDKWHLHQLYQYKFWSSKNFLSKKSLDGNLANDR